MPDQSVACLPIASLERLAMERALFQSTILYMESMFFLGGCSAVCLFQKTCERVLLLRPTRARHGPAISR